MAITSVVQDWTAAEVTDRQGHVVTRQVKHEDGTTSQKPIKTGIFYRVLQDDQGRRHVQLNYCISTKVGNGPNSVYHAISGEGREGMINIAGTYLSIRAGTVVKKAPKKEPPRPVLAADADSFPEF